MGDVPAKELFLQSGLQQALRPYFALTKAVRRGDLDAFEAALATHQARFIADDALTFVQRLRHNVIKAGLRKISMAYSSISFDDIARKLGLENERVAEGVVAKVRARPCAHARRRCSRRSLRLRALRTA